MTDDHAESRHKQFRKLIKTLQEKKETNERKRKQQQFRMQERADNVSENVKKKKKTRQSKLKEVLKIDDSAAADLAVTQWAIVKESNHNRRVEFRSQM